MELNGLLFPKPKASYTDRSLSQYLIYIPKSGDLPKISWKLRVNKLKYAKINNIETKT